MKPDGQDPQVQNQPSSHEATSVGPTYPLHPGSSKVAREWARVPTSDFPLQSFPPCVQITTVTSPSLLPSLLPLSYGTGNKEGHLTTFPTGLLIFPSHGFQLVFLIDLKVLSTDDLWKVMERTYFCKLYQEAQLLTIHYGLNCAYPQKRDMLRS